MAKLATGDGIVCNVMTRAKMTRRIVYNRLMISLNYPYIRIKLSAQICSLILEKNLVLVAIMFHWHTLNKAKNTTL